MIDPYVYPGTGCLVNKLNITDPDQLAVAEARIVSIRDVEVARETIPGAYNVSHWQAFHRKLFGDVYSWAGTFRSVDIHKAGASFGNWMHVEVEAAARLARVADCNGFLGYTRDAFLPELADLYGDLNAYHPFREGNGRTLRAFLRQLGAAAGFMLDWSELSRQDNIDACRANLLTADTKLLVAALDPVVRKI